MPISKERLAEIAAIADEDIDTSDIPEADEQFFKKAKLILPGGSARARRFAVPSVSVTYAQTGSSTKATRSACGRCRSALTRGVASNTY